MRTSYHNHTTWSDGQPTVAELVSAARQAGLEEVGVSDHYVLRPDGVQPEWSMRADRLGDYVADVRTAAALSRGPVVRLGIEADFFPETVETLRAALARHPFDYVIGSVHFLSRFPVDESRRYWDGLSEEERNEKWRFYWQRVRQMAGSGVFDLAAHLDLPKKYGHRPTVDLTAEAHAALDALAAAGMALEINTAGWSLPIKEAYPALDLLRAARERGIPLVINADAHLAHHLTRDFARGVALARQAGYTERVRFEGRRRYPLPLEGG